MAELFVFELDDLRFGLHVAAVGRVVSAVEITPLPRAPAIVLGVIDVAGAILPVVDLRQRLGLSARHLALKDRFIITRTEQRSLVIVADAVEGVVDFEPSQITDPATFLPGAQQVTGIAHHEKGIIFIHDLELFLSLHEAVALDQALAANQYAVDRGYDQ